MGGLDSGPIGFEKSPISVDEDGTVHVDLPDGSKISIGDKSFSYENKNGQKVSTDPSSVGLDGNIGGGTVSGKVEHGPTGAISGDITIKRIIGVL